MGNVDGDGTNGPKPVGAPVQKKRVALITLAPGHGLPAAVSPEGPTNNYGAAVVPRPQNCIRFVVSLKENPEVSLKQLIRQAGKHRAKLATPFKAPEAEHEEKKPIEKIEANDSHLRQPLPAATNRYNVIEKLEQKYAGVQVKNDEVDLEASSGEDSDDWYDMDDPFVDDSELVQEVNKQRASRLTKTKHEGFFINKGTEIEVVNNSQAVEIEGEMVHRKALKTKPTKANKKGLKPGRGRKEYMEDWDAAADEWKPGTEIDAAIEELKRASKEGSKATSVKYFPRHLDDHLAKVDALVLAKHNRKRPNAYFARLMRFLPYSNSVLKNSMVRLQARDEAATAKKDFKKQLSALQIKGRSESFIEEKLSEFVWDADSKLLLYNTVTAHEHYVSKANEYRDKLKPLDRKIMQEQDYKKLKPLREKAKLWTKIASFFPKEMQLDAEKIKKAYVSISRSEKRRREREGESVEVEKEELSESSRPKKKVKTSSAELKGSAGKPSKNDIAIDARTPSLKRPKPLENKKTKPSSSVKKEKSKSGTGSGEKDLATTGKKKSKSIHAKDSDLARKDSKGGERPTETSSPQKTSTVERLSSAASSPARGQAQSKGPIRGREFDECPSFDEADFRLGAVR